MKNIIYTSYYGQINNLLKQNITPISISLYPPKNLNILQYKPLAPTYKMFQNGYTWEEFRQRLNKKDVYSVLRELLDLSNGKQYALLCYEKEPEECHRSLVLEWIKSKGGDIEEFEYKPENPCLSIQQPWAELIIRGHKDIENRTWNTRFRGKFFIHASKKFDTSSLEDISSKAKENVNEID